MSYKGSNSLQEEKVMLARDEKDSMYEPKPNKKAIRILTVAAYVFCVSLAAIMLSLYYVFFWDPSTKSVTVKPATNCGHFLKTSAEQVSEREFRKITGIERKAEQGRAVKPSIGPSIPTGVINKDRVFDVKEIQMVDMVLGSSSSTTTEATVIRDQGDNDSEYQSDDAPGDEDDYEMEESSGEETVLTEYKVTRPEVGSSSNRSNNQTNEIAEELNGNEI